MILSEQIKQARQAQGLTQLDLAKRCNMKQSVISRLEDSSNRMMTVKTLARVATALGCNLEITLSSSNLT